MQKQSPVVSEVADSGHDHQSGTDTSAQDDEEVEQSAEYFSLMCGFDKRITRAEKLVASLLVDWITPEKLESRLKSTTLIRASDRVIKNLENYEACKSSLNRIGEAACFRLAYTNNSNGVPYDAFAIMNGKRHFASVFIHKDSSGIPEGKLRDAFTYSLENQVQVWMCIVDESDPSKAKPLSIDDSLIFNHVYGPRKLRERSYLHYWERKLD